MVAADQGNLDITALQVRLIKQKSAQWTGILFAKVSQWTTQAGNR